MTMVSFWKAAPKASRLFFAKEATLDLAGFSKEIADQPDFINFENSDDSGLVARFSLEFLFEERPIVTVWHLALRGAKNNRSSYSLDSIGWG